MMPMCVILHNIRDCDGFVFVPIMAAPAPHINTLKQNAIHIMCINVLFLYDNNTTNMLMVVILMTIPVKEKNVMILSYHNIMFIANLKEWLSCSDCQVIVVYIYSSLKLAISLNIIPIYEIAFIVNTRHFSFYPSRNINYVSLLWC